MSRSYKKYPIRKQKNDKSAKRQANRKVRRTKDVPSGKAYKKYYNSYDIYDYGFRWSRIQAIIEYFNEYEYSWLKQRYKTLEEYLIYWEKCVKRK